MAGAHPMTEAESGGRFNELLRPTMTKEAPSSRVNAMTNVEIVDEIAKMVTKLKKAASAPLNLRKSKHPVIEKFLAFDAGPSAQISKLAAAKDRLVEQIKAEADAEKAANVSQRQP